MLQGLTRFSLKNGAVIIMAMFMVVFGGIYSYLRIPNSDYPNVDIPWIHVSIAYPGATPEQSWSDIGKPLEGRLAGISGVQKLISYSSTNYQYFTLEVNMNRMVKDVDRDIQDVLNQVQLPTIAQKPVIQNESAENPAVYTFSVTSDSMDIGQVQAYVDNTLSPALSAVSGVGEVRINGDTKKDIFVQVNLQKLARSGVSWQQVQQALIANNFSAPIGNTNVGPSTMPIVVGSQVTSLDEIRKFPIVVMKRNATGLTSSVVHIGDVADVVYGPDPNNRSITRTDGEPGVVVQVLPSTNANTIQLVHDIQNVIDHSTVPPSYHINVLNNQADQVKHNVQGMIREGALGALFAVIVTLVFLRDLRATLVAIFSIPLSIFAAVIVMNAVGYSLNMMTLSGMAVAVGRVVDDSIVVIENIYRRLKEKNSPRDANMIQNSTLEVGSAITSSTITTLAVFLPMTFVPGIVGHFFAPFAWTVIIALSFSLLVALMVVPIVGKYSLMKVRPTEHRETRLQRSYRSTLRWSLSHKWIVVVLGLLLLAESGFAATKLGFNFLPSSRTTMFTIDASMPTASNIQRTNAVAQKIEHVVAHFQGVKTYQTFVSPGDATVVVFVSDSVKDTDTFGSGLRSTVEGIAGAHRITVAGASGPGGSQMNLILQGSNWENLRLASETVVSALSKIPGLADVTSSAQASMPQVQVDVNAVSAANLGLDPMTVAGSIRNMLSGDSVTKVALNGQTTDVNLMIGKGNFQTLGELGNQTLTTPSGVQVKIRDIAKLSVVKGPSSIARLNQQEYIEIDGTITAKNAGGVTSQINKTLHSLHLPSGVTTDQEGAAQAMQEGFTNIALAMIVSFVLVLIAMLITFGEWSAPLAIVFALPFAIVGGFNGLWLTHQPLGMPGMIGFMMLIGIIVTNAIVLMDRALRQMKAGLCVRDALIEAGGIRLRPILMTATATIGALIPLAVTNDAGLISKTLAIVVIGGLFTSTLLTLVIVPIMYEWLVGIRQRVKRAATDDVTIAAVTHPTLQ